MGDVNVDIEPATLRWVGSRYAGCFLTLATTGAVDVAAASQQAHAAVVAEGLSDERQPAWVSAVVEGVDAVHLYIRYDDATRAQVRALTQMLAQVLSGAGLAGALRRPYPRYPDEWVTSDALYRLGITTRYYSRALIDGDFVERLVAHHEVDRLQNHVLSLGGGISLRIRDLAAAMTVMTVPMNMGILTGWTNEPPTAASVDAGDRVAHGWTPRVTRSEELQITRAALTALGPDLDYACARIGTGRTRRAADVAPGGISSTLFVQRAAMWPLRVPDAHGLQVLTTAHLDRATDLTGWHTSQVGSDRYLVVARDLAPWFTDDGPDPHTLERARADFGSMIATQAEDDAEKAQRIAELERLAAEATPSEGDG